MEGGGKREKAFQLPSPDWILNGKLHDLIEPKNHVLEASNKCYYGGLRCHSGHWTTSRFIFGAGFKLRDLDYLYLDNKQGNS